MKIIEADEWLFIDVHLKMIVRAFRGLAAALRGASVPAFAGDAVTVNTTVRLH